MRIIELGGTGALARASGSGSKDPRSPPQFAVLRCSKEKLAQPKEAKSLWQEARSLYQSVNVQAGVDESEGQIVRLTGK